MLKGIDNQPVSNIEWVHRETLHANGYNPNTMPPIEFDTLKKFILDFGWLAPITVHPDGEIADGFHRWTVSEDEEVYEMTDGYIPVIRLPRLENNMPDQMVVTMNMNRQRGSHGVVPVAKLVAELADTHGISREEIGDKLGMEPEEVNRLLDVGIVDRVGQDDFGKAWVPEGYVALEDDE